MPDKVKKIVICIAFLVMLIIAGYIIFVRNNLITSRPYFLVTAIAFILSCITLLFVILKGKMQDKKSLKLMIILIVILIVFQILSLPVANLFSQSFPIWPPRGTIYQMPGLSLDSSISQNDVGLLMHYYLDEKILHANEDYPLNSHFGFLFITDEYEFVQENYPAFSKQEAEDFYNEYEKLFITTTVRENPKLKIDSFLVHLFTNIKDEIILIVDDEKDWYFMPPDLYKEVFDE